MCPCALLALKGISTVSLAAILGTGAIANEVQRISFKMAATNTKYTNQLEINIGDVPGHQLRLFEIHRTFPKDPPIINGVKIEQIWSRGFSDYINANGPSISYLIFEMENRDKIFAQVSSTAQGVVEPNGSRTLTSSSEGTMTGGTGMFAGITGLVRISTVFNPQTGVNEGQTDIEYSLAAPTDAKR